MSPQNNNIPDEAAGVTGNAAGAPYSAVGHGPDTTTVAESVAYHHAEIAAHDKPIQSDPIGNAIIGAIAGGGVKSAAYGASVAGAAVSGVAKVVGTAAKEIAWRYLDKAVTEAQQSTAVHPVDHHADDTSSHNPQLSAENDHPAAEGGTGQEYQGMSSTHDSYADPGMSSSDAVCADPGMSSTDDGSSAHHQ